LYNKKNQETMYPIGNLQNSNSGERHSSYQHYAMSQVNNEKPVIERDHEEQSQSWGKPSSTSPSYYPSNLDSERNLSSVNRLASSSSSLFDRNLQDQMNVRDSSNYQQQAHTNQYHGAGQSVLPAASAYRQEQTSSYSKISNQQSGAQLSHDAPHFHGFKFQVLPGFSFCAREKREFFWEGFYWIFNIMFFCF
jgi:hypothetical protein